MRKRYDIPKVEVMVVNTALMNTGFGNISGKGGYGPAPAHRSSETAPAF